ncbi:STAS domain-containing protein [Amycolatopsis sp. FDAARGOS 1241]|uniref:STAS domain-containing protein n=1 Tax=Amycolatopsis sp. FDAARGOS 1241 TaxID=2778070 RepID=UPI00194F0E35|nr:STAS domain-containing protein [Amycolatopsis sp. FDAARGOS 1241]QRP48435.1 STAS domain-containing protein [Amycolatopsis sp. FDAARGOS 1241]
MVITARGDFDAVTSPDLHDAIAEVFVDPPAVLVIDLTETAFFGAAGPPTPTAVCWACSVWTGSSFSTTR